MKVIWNLIVAACAIGNIIWVANLWHGGGQPDWFVWSSSIMFSIVVAGRCVDELLRL